MRASRRAKGGPSVPDVERGIRVAILVTGGAGFIGGWLRETPGARKVMDRLAGLVFVALALRLVITER